MYQTICCLHLSSWSFMCVNIILQNVFGTSNMVDENVGHVLFKENVVESTKLVIFHTEMILYKLVNGSK